MERNQAKAQPRVLPRMAQQRGGKKKKTQGPDLDELPWQVCASSSRLLCGPVAVILAGPSAHKVALMNGMASPFLQTVLRSWNGVPGAVWGPCVGPLHVIQLN